MITTIPLFPGITLRCFPDQRFKQGCLNVQLLRPMCRDEAALNALLPEVLLRGTQSAPDLRCITRQLDDLYGASAGAMVRRVGDYQTIVVHMGFIDDRYALEGDEILAPTVTLLRQLLLEPVLENGCFRQDYVESEKKNLISALESTRNNKRVYAVNQTLKQMCGNDSFGIPRLGEPEQVSAITAACLYDHYRKILRESPVNLFYVGSAQPEQVAELLRPVFAGLDRQVTPLPPQTALSAGRPNRITEEMDVTQGKLCMGYVTPVTTRDDRFAAMQVLNTILGGGMTSKLFMQVREKQSLCYDIGSTYHGSKGIVMVSAGIDFEKQETVEQEVRRQLHACCRGEFSQAELNAAKQAILTQLQATHDSPGAIEGYYSSGVLSGMTMTPDAYMQAVEAVTPEMAAQVAQTLHEHTVYFLRGKP